MTNSTSQSARHTKSRADDSRGSALSLPQDESPAKLESLICPVCGEEAVQEKCKIICRSEICRGRVIMNCSEF